MPKIFQVDAFTKEKFKGNPAGVCLLDCPVSEQWMQAIAAEMNVSETAFVSPQKNGFDLKWFTPQIEVDLCGHATLASAFVLYQENILAKGKPARFHTKSGLLQVVKTDDMLEMDFPAEPAREIAPTPILSRALGVNPQFVGQNRMDVLVQVASEQEVLEILPDFKLLSELPVRGVIVTALSTGKKYDFISRFFAPRAGVDEDPVTGSAHCCLGPYWQERLNKEKLVGFQASKRGGFVFVQVCGNRVKLSGYAVTIFKGEIVVKDF